MTLAECSIAIKCADDLLIERCIDSVDDPTVAINVVATPSHRIQTLLEAREIPYTLTDYGNIAKSAQLSVEEAEHDNVIVMDSDAYFAPGAIKLLRNALETNAMAKPRLEFHSTGTRIFRLIAESRTRYNSVPTLATNPGLALRRNEIARRCGYVFNPQIRWTEDADLNYRMQRDDVPLTYVSEAVVHHDSVSLGHELRCAFLYGVGKRLSIENTPGRIPDEEFPAVIRAIAKGGTLKKALKNVGEYGLDGAMLAAAWRTLYLTGYHAQKRLGRWAIDG